MASRLLYFCLAVLLLLTTFIVTPPTHAATPRIIAHTSASIVALDSDGTYVTWMLSRSSIYSEIWADSPDGPPQLLFAHQGSAVDHISSPRMDNGVVIWTETGLAESPPFHSQTTIQARNLKTGEDFVIATAYEIPQRPDISGSQVAWVEVAQNNIAQVKVRDIGSMAEPIVLAEFSGSPSGGSPIPSGRVAIEDGRVIWGQISGYDHASSQALVQLVMFDSALGGPRELIETVGPPAFDLNGDTLVYTDKEGSLTALDVRTGIRKTIAPASSVFSTSNAMTTDGRYVFWHERQPSVPGAWSPPPSQVWGYDLQTNSIFRTEAKLSRLDLESGRLYGWRKTSDDKAAEILAYPIAELLPNAPVENPKHPDLLFFPETGHTLGSTFRAFWEQHGGLPVFGYPNTEEFKQLNADTGHYYTVQYFERQRFEHHPENRGTVYEVLLGRLGAETLQRQGRDWTTLPKGNPNAPHYYPQTGHAIAEVFWEYWSTHGLEFDGQPGTSPEESLALFGYPISEPTMETNSSGDTVLTQWFERARFEFHPDNPKPYQVLLGRLSADLVDEYWP